ncbi:hypothetical protein [Agrococcus jejuensis]|uniref:Uncharacterized protein n=1 Tax=Agrococcus jejuensis TaxID=399736 RepID=A0A1G8GUR8_9MICO|nr:hypothetical protein [Agrococcus jejuensis]SDH98146.1 hypothetical protein SAMN04489720_3080 [Agrococcus jejuensis]
MRTTRARAMRSTLLTVLATAVLAGCVVLPPAMPAATTPAEPLPSATPTPSAAPTPSATPTTTPSATPEVQPEPDAAQCQASDAAMARIIETTGALDAAVPGDDVNDWATADVVIADIRAQYDAWLAATTDPVLLSAAPALDTAITDAAGVVARRDDDEVSLLGTIPYSLDILYAAAGVVLPCDLG